MTHLQNEGDSSEINLTLSLEKERPLASTAVRGKETRLCALDEGD